MPELLTLYECSKLRARLSLAACAANRAKSDTIVTVRDDISLAVRPFPCQTCTDWQVWECNPSKESTVSTLEKEQPEPTTLASTTPVCQNCGAAKRYSLGLCKSCYQKQRKAKKRAEQAAQIIPAVKTAPVAQIAPLPCGERRIYLACPYTDQSADVMRQRRDSATTVANTLLRQGSNVYSPLSHGAAVGEGLPPDFGFWGVSCLSFIEHWATDVYVLMIPGWDASAGVQAEIEAATAHRIQITHILPLAMSN